MSRNEQDRWDAGELDYKAERDESDEVADNMASALIRQNTSIPMSFNEALRIVKRRMPDESSQVQDNVAESLLRWSKP